MTRDEHPIEISVANSFGKNIHLSQFRTMPFGKNSEWPEKIQNCKSLFTQIPQHGFRIQNRLLEPLNQSQPKRKKPIVRAKCALKRKPKR
jgi:hypothetical protein